MKMNFKIQTDISNNFYSLKIDEQIKLILDNHLKWYLMCGFISLKCKDTSVHEWTRITLAAVDMPCEKEGYYMAFWCWENEVACTTFLKIYFKSLA